MTNRSKPRDLPDRDVVEIQRWVIQGYKQALQISLANEKRLTTALIQAQDALRLHRTTHLEWLEKREKNGFVLEFSNVYHDPQYGWQWRNESEDRPQWLKTLEEKDHTNVKIVRPRKSKKPVDVEVLDVEKVDESASDG